MAPHVLAGESKIVYAEDDSVPLLLLAIVCHPLLSCVRAAVLAVAREGTSTDIAPVLLVPHPTNNEPPLLIPLSRVVKAVTQTRRVD